MGSFAPWCFVRPMVLLMLVNLWALPSAATTNSVSSCPVPGPQPLASVDLRAYLGKWYQIGASAGFAFFTESGLTCIQAEYSVLNETDSGPTIRVVNSGLPLAGREVTPLVRAFSGNSSVLCQLLATFFSADSFSEKDVRSIRDGIHSLAEAAGGYGSLQAKIFPLLALMGKLTRHLKMLVSAAVDAPEAVGNLQLAVGAAMQVPGSNRASEIKHAVWAVRHLISKIESRTTSINKVLDRILRKVSDVDPSAPAAGREAAAAIARSTMKLQGSFKAWQARATDIVATFDAACKAAIAAGKVEKGSAPRRFSLAGVATQSPTLPSPAGALVVSFPFGVPGNYWIIALEGEAKDGYKAALVYSCSPEESGGFLGGESVQLWILSRTPKLEDDIIERLLSVAVEKGVILTCSNAFIPTVQDSKICSY